jgi:hypothetical protein
MSFDWEEKYDENKNNPTARIKTLLKSMNVQEKNDARFL